MKVKQRKNAKKLENEEIKLEKIGINWENLKTRKKNKLESKKMRKQENEKMRKRENKTNEEKEKREHRKWDKENEIIRKLENEIINYRANLNERTHEKTRKWGNNTRENEKKLRRLENEKIWNLTKTYFIEMKSIFYVYAYDIILNYPDKINLHLHIFNLKILWQIIINIIFIWDSWTKK